ncbi:MAG TPA: hypothetical protein VGB77_16185 [Abditibacteriaceae bacterium]|jgi:hypothetical protein
MQPRATFNRFLPNQLDKTGSSTAFLGFNSRVPSEYSRMVCVMHGLGLFSKVL